MILGERRDRRLFHRPPVERPSAGAAATFICPACDVVLADGVVYTSCPACELPVDWIDLSLPVWCCPTCDVMVNEPRDEAPRCIPCDRFLERIEALEQPFVAGPARPPGLLWKMLGTVLSIVGLAYLVAIPLSLALDPRWRLFALGLLLPVLLVPLTAAGMFLWSLGASMRELRDLVRDRKTRVIHGLEHAAVALLEADQQTVYGGLTHPGFFEVHLHNFGRAEDQTKIVRQAVSSAIRRIRHGERELAYHPRCGTSMLVSALLISLFVVAATGIGFFMRLRLEMLLGLSIGCGVVYALLARPLGLLVQRWLTVSTDFRNARVVRMVRVLTNGGDRVRFDVYLRVR